MKRWKMTTVLAAAAAMMLSGSLSVSAAGVSDVFDADYYENSYEDLREAFGGDVEALLWHYMTYGLEEGRTGSKVFDVAEYRNAYKDLEEAFGDDWDAYVNHYVTYGITENRTAGVYGEINVSADDNSNNDSSEDDNSSEDDSNKIWLRNVGDEVNLVLCDAESPYGQISANVSYYSYNNMGTVGGTVIKPDNAGTEMEGEYVEDAYVLHDFIAAYYYKYDDGDAYGDWRANDSSMWYNFFGDDDFYNVESFDSDGVDIDDENIEWWGGWKFALEYQGVTYSDCFGCMVQEVTDWYYRFVIKLPAVDGYDGVHPMFSLDGRETWIVLD